MSDTRIDGSPKPKLKLYEDASDDPAKIAEDKAKADFEAKKNDVCKQDPDRIPCAPKAKDRTSTGVPYSDLAKTMSQPKPAPPPDRAALAEEADQIADRLSRNPLPYVGKKEDQARLVELQSKLAATPETGSPIPKTTDATRASNDGWWTGDSGTDGLSAYSGGSMAQFSSSGATAQLGHVSAQVGVDNDLQASAFHVAVTDDGSNTLAVDGPSARATAGIGRNDDGSMGVHVGASAGLASAQITRKLDGGGSVSVGVSQGVGAGVSVGGKTNERGDAAACVQISALVFTVGACLPLKL